MKAEPFNPLLLTTEKVWLGQIKQLARAYNWRFYHTYNSMRSTHGFPDLVLVRPPRVVYAELKREKGKLTVEQVGWLEALQGCGQEVYCWRPSDFDEAARILK